MFVVVVDVVCCCQEVSQPAIFVCSMAAVEKLRAEKGDAAVDEATCAMGLSLGEYSALCFAGALSFEDGVKVTKARWEWVPYGMICYGMIMCREGVALMMFITPRAEWRSTKLVVWNTSISYDMMR